MDMAMWRALRSPAVARDMKILILLRLAHDGCVSWERVRNELDGQHLLDQPAIVLQMSLGEVCALFEQDSDNPSEQG